MLLEISHFFIFLFCYQAPFRSILILKYVLIEILSRKLYKIKNKFATQSYFEPYDIIITHCSCVTCFNLKISILKVILKMPLFQFEQYVIGIYEPAMIICNWNKPVLLLLLVSLRIITDHTYKHQFHHYTVYSDLWFLKITQWFCFVNSFLFF